MCSVGVYVPISLTFVRSSDLSESIVLCALLIHLTTSRLHFISICLWLLLVLLSTLHPEGARYHTWGPPEVSWVTIGTITYLDCPRGAEPNSTGTCSPSPR